jgi:hypothetical protein
LITTSKVGGFPSGAAFDSANIWVTNYGDGTVTKLRANDGAVLGTFTVEPAPTGVAFDGTNIWVSTFNNEGVAFDGANIWAVNAGSNTASKMQISVAGKIPAGSSPLSEKQRNKNFLPSRPRYPNVEDRLNLSGVLCVGGERSIDQNTFLVAALPVLGGSETR